MNKLFQIVCADLGSKPDNARFAIEELENEQIVTTHEADTLEILSIGEAHSVHCGLRLRRVA